MNELGSKALNNSNLNHSRLPQAYDEEEPDWFPNEGDRQWWREKHQVRPINRSLDRRQQEIHDGDLREVWSRETDGATVPEVRKLEQQEVRGTDEGRTADFRLPDGAAARASTVFTP